MLNIDPNKSSQVKSWNSTTVNERLGFAKRDRSSTDATSIPMVVPRLGYDYVKFFSDRDVSSGTTTEQQAAVKWQRTSDSLPLPALSVPGIMTLDYWPVFSQPTTDANGNPSDIKRIFTNVWWRMRRINNMTEKFQPSDIQWISAALMEILAHVANLRRILKVMQRALKTQKSDYTAAELLLTALGFPGVTALEARHAWKDCWTTYNVDILGQLRNVTWFTNIVPGRDRWAGLNTEIYKDDPNRTDYTQLYIIRPAKLAAFKEGVVPGSDPQRVGWYCEWEEYMGTGINKLTAYFARVANLIQEVFYSDNAQLVLATISAIDARSWKDDMNISFAPIAMEPVPWEGEELAFTYDFNMMLAIHNATIFKSSGSGTWFFPGTPFEDTENNILVQNLQIGTSNASGYMYNFNLAAFAKAINLPWYEATQDDIINATQWTVAAMPVKADDGTYYLPANSVGTEILSNLRMIFFKRTSAGSQIDSVVSIPTIYAEDTTTSYGFPIQSNDSKKLAMLQSFALYPICYLTQDTQAMSDAGSFGRITGIINQEDVLYAASDVVLEQIHAQFLRNFWGFPFIVVDEGSYSPSSNA